MLFGRHASDRMARDFPTPGGALSRAGLGFLIFLAALLVFDGAPAQRMAMAEAPLTLEKVFDAHWAANEVAKVNPGLSTEELRRIGVAVMRNSEKYRVDPDLIIAVIKVESTARPWAVSHSGALGLMQVMPHMGDSMDLPGNLTTIEVNIEAGCRILADNIRRLGENDGISAYFWGNRIRGVAYLDRVRQARREVQRPSNS
jgi:soluble lytic murein transglycosylase-like protein